MREPVEELFPRYSRAAYRAIKRNHPKARVLPFGPDNLISPHITLPEYIDLVVGMLIGRSISRNDPM